MSTLCGSEEAVHIAFGYTGNLGQRRGGVQVSQDNGGTFESLTSGQDSIKRRSPTSKSIR